MKTWVKLLVVIPLLGLALVLKGFVITKLWAWFAVPLFSLPAIAVHQGVGLSLLASLLTGLDSPEKKEDEDDAERTVRHLVAAFLAPLLILLWGWIAHSFA